MLLEFFYRVRNGRESSRRDEVRAHVTVELAHPSTEPLASRSPTTPTHQRWWFLWTTPGRILTIGVVLSTLVIASAFATSTTINQRQQALTTVLNHTEPLSFAAGHLSPTLSVGDPGAAA